MSGSVADRAETSSFSTESSIEGAAGDGYGAVSGGVHMLWRKRGKMQVSEGRAGG
jgi:hypothetical protein